MSKKDKQNWLELALAAAENARKLRVSGNDPRADDWDNVAAARAAVAQAEAQTRLADNSDRIAVALERIAERAAWQWRPVTEDWPHYHDRVVIAHWGGTWAQFARRVQSDDGEDEWLLDDGRKFDFESASVALLTSPPPLPH